MNGKIVIVITTMSDVKSDGTFVVGDVGEVYRIGDMSSRERDGCPDIPGIRSIY